MGKHLYFRCDILLALAVIRHFDFLLLQWKLAPICYLLDGQQQDDRELDDMLNQALDMEG